MCIYLADEDEAATQNRLSQLFEKNQIDVLQTTPTKMRSYILDRKNLDYLRGLKAIVLGGEAFPRERISQPPGADGGTLCAKSFCHRRKPSRENHVPHRRPGTVPQ